MGLAEAFDEASFTEPINGTICGVQRALEEHPDDADFLFGLIDHGKPSYIGHAPLSRWLKGQGVDVSEKVLSQHRLGSCKCRERMPERYES